MIITLILLSLLITISYISYTIALFWDDKNPASVSDTYYLLEDLKKEMSKRGKKHIGGTLFTLYSWLASFTLVIPWLELTPEPYQFLCFFSISGLLFVGTASQFKESMTNKVHYISALICAISSQILVFLYGYWWVSVLAFIPFVYLAFKYNKKKLFYIEIASFVSTYVSILLLYIFK